METLVNIHPFQHLGPAPYSCVGMTENAIRYPDGSTKAGGSCAHCGTGIRYEFLVRDGSGNIHKVGSSCVEKTGRAALVSQAKALKLQHGRKKRAEKRNAEIQAAIERCAERERTERAANFGPTNSEYDQAQRDNETRDIVKSTKWLQSVLFEKSRYSNFCEDVYLSLRRGCRVREFSAGQVAAMRDIFAKQSGRRNSKAYKLAVIEFDRLAGLDEQDYDKE